jgi:hypothetical protein
MANRTYHKINQVIPATATRGNVFVAIFSDDAKSVDRVIDLPDWLMIEGKAGMREYIVEEYTESHKNLFVYFGPSFMQPALQEDGTPYPISNVHDVQTFNPLTRGLSLIKLITA